MSDIRLIDANALCKKSKPMYGRSIMGYIDHVAEGAVTLNEIHQAPTIDAVPVEHGRWEWYEDWGPSTWLEPPDLNKAGWKCTNCGIDLGDYLTDCLGVNVYVDEEDKMPKIKRCPRCGCFPCQMCEERENGDLCRMCEIEGGYRSFHQWRGIQEEDSHA